MFRRCQATGTRYGHQSCLCKTPVDYVSTAIINEVPLQMCQQSSRKRLCHVRVACLLFDAVCVGSETENPARLDSYYRTEAYNRVRQLNISVQNSEGLAATLVLLLWQAPDWYDASPLTSTASYEISGRPGYRHGKHS